MNLLVLNLFMHVLQDVTKVELPQKAMEIQKISQDDRQTTVKFKIFIHVKSL
jgi:hypothetical protein